MDGAQRFHASVAAQDPDAVRLDAVLRRVGLSVQKNSHPGIGVRPMHVRCISVLNKMMKDPGEDVLEEALGLIADAWPDEPNQFGGCAVQAISRSVGLMRKAGLPRDRLAEIISNTDLLDLSERCRAFGSQYGGPAWKHMTKRLIDEVNKGRRQTARIEVSAV